MRRILTLNGIHVDSKDEIEANEHWSEFRKGGGNAILAHGAHCGPQISGLSSMPCYRVRRPVYVRDYGGPMPLG